MWKACFLGKTNFLSEDKSDRGDRHVSHEVDIMLLMSVQGSQLPTPCLHPSMPRKPCVFSLGVNVPTHFSVSFAVRGPHVIVFRPMASILIINRNAGKPIPKLIEIVVYFLYDLKVGRAHLCSRGTRSHLQDGSPIRLASWCWLWSGNCGLGASAPLHLGFSVG